MLHGCFPCILHNISLHTYQRHWGFLDVYDTYSLELVKIFERATPSVLDNFKAGFYFASNPCVRVSHQSVCTQFELVFMRLIHCYRCVMPGSNACVLSLCVIYIYKLKLSWMIPPPPNIRCTAPRLCRMMWNNGKCETKRQHAGIFNASVLCQTGQTWRVVNEWRHIQLILDLYIAQWYKVHHSIQIHVHAIEQGIVAAGLTKKKDSAASFHL